MHKKNFYLFFILAIWGFTACDTVVNDPVGPNQNNPNSSAIPQATLEAFRQVYTGVQDFRFRPLNEGKTWENVFVYSDGTVISAVDYKGEVIDLEQLNGLKKALPDAVKQSAAGKGADNYIAGAYELSKSPAQSAGFKVLLKKSDTGNTELFFDEASKSFNRQTPQFSIRINAIYASSTEQINFTPGIPEVVRQFFTQNQFKSAALLVTRLDDGNITIDVNYREKQNDSVISSRILMSEKGEVLQWETPLQRELTYRALKVEELPGEISSYLTRNANSFTVDYALAKQSYAKDAVYFVEVQNGTKSIRIGVDVTDKNNLSVTNSRQVDQSLLPQNILTYLNNNITGWTFSSARLVEEVSKNGVGGNINHYTIEVLKGSGKYALRFNGKGEFQYQYTVR